MKGSRALAASLFLFCAAVCLAAATAPTAVRDLDNRSVNPLAPGNSSINVLVFVRSDCPLSKRYAPELQRIAQEFKGDQVNFWLVFADRSETADSVRQFLSDYKLPGSALFDSKGELVRAAAATVAPEAAVFNRKGERVYGGRIDDLYVDLGKSRPAPQVHDLEDAIRATLNGKPVAHAQTRAVGCALADVE